MKRMLFLALLILLVTFLNGCQSGTEIQTAQIEKIIKDVDSGAFLFFVKAEGNTLSIEYKSSFSTSSIVTRNLYEIVNDITLYISDLGLTPDIKITAIDMRNEYRKTSMLSWSETQRLINLEMSYDEWEKGLNNQ